MKPHALPTTNTGPDPYHRGLRTISAAEIQWQRVQRPPTPPPKRKRASTNGSEEGAAAAGGESDEALDAAAAAAAAAAIEDDEEEEEAEKEFMVFLLSKPGDYFSREFDALVAGIAPCFPSILFLRGLSTDHYGLVGQMALRGLPKLLLFEDSLLKVCSYMCVHTHVHLFSFLGGGQFVV